MEHFKKSHQWQKKVNLIGLNLQFQSSRGFYLNLGIQKDFFSNRITQAKTFNTDVSIKASRALTSSIQFGWKGFLIKQDQDKDGFADNIDKCPLKAEDKDGFEDFDGCPEIDNDNDKIWDAQDRCPLISEDIDGFEDGDGCPEFDNDKDGLADKQDKCPLKAEDKDGFEDFDGCPEFDNDNDGILDTDDKCVNQKEDVDSFEDEDGCPEFDNDKDGIPDDRDQCPNHPETINNIKDQDGCPENEQGGVIGDFPYGNHYDIVFVNNTTQFTSGSFRILDRLAKQLKTQNQIKLQVKVHYDNSIGYEKAHMLTAKQARAIKSYLVSHQGVPHQRIIASGVGMGSPVASNKNPKGRLKNRRIELLPYQN
jgi:outer membrane protein OmpA-like peptidoglycan-associated protein